MSTSTAVELVVVIGAGSMGQAIVRRIGVGKTILLADLNKDAAGTAARTLQAAGFPTSTATVDVASHDSVARLAETASALGAVVHVVHTAGLSPAQASPEAIIAVDLVGVAFVLEEFGRIIASGGSGIVIASQAGHMLPPLPAEQNEALARTPAGELAQLPFLQPDIVTNSGAAYALAKRANILRVQAASVDWGDRSARLNSLSPGIIMTPLAMDELKLPRRRRVPTDDQGIRRRTGRHARRDRGHRRIPDGPRRLLHYRHRPLDRRRRHRLHRSRTLPAQHGGLTRTELAGRTAAAKE
jgi:NAD(P)-dependent dehydrogenase (short-subunit alcohol dehydrogenase family)